MNLRDVSPRALRFIDNNHDPMRRVHEHLRDLVDWIRHEVVILIDDLDRCQAPWSNCCREFQTLFRHVPITFVIAADRDWLPDSYAKE
jgi:hypothetical protein